MGHEVRSGPRSIDGDAILDRLRAWAQELGFSQIGVADVDLHEAEPGLREWLAAGFHGGMRYMERHGMRRARPAELVPGTVRVITARMDYLPRDADAGWVERDERIGEGIVVGQRFGEGSTVGLGGPGDRATF